MRKLLVFAGLAIGVLTGAKASAQTALPRSAWVGNASSSNGGDVPAHAFDGNSSTRWSSGANQAQGQWFTVDFGSTQEFSQVSLDVGGSTGDYPRGYEVYVSADAVNWNSPIASGTGASGVLTIVFPQQTARYLGIIQTSNSSTNWWSIAELNVYSGVVPTAPLATTGWVATASTSGSSDTPPNAIDGNISTRYTTGTAQASGQWFKVDMVAPQVIAGLVMDSGSSSSDYARGFQVFASSDNSTWTSIATGMATSSPVTANFPQTTARFLKVQLTSGAPSNWWSIAEFTALTPIGFTPSAAVLARLGWTATASVSGSGSPPANALDDNGSSRWTTGVNQAPGQYFIIDARAAYAFSKLTLDTGSSSTGDYPRGYQVFVSNDGSTWGSAIATGVGSGRVTTITFPQQNARYTKVVQTSSSSTNWWSIAEANIYGAAPAVLVREGWTATASLNSSNAQLGIDGNVSTQWSTNTSQVPGETFQLDMKTPQTFDEITLDVNCNPSDYPRGYQVYVSSDGSNWGNPIASGAGQSSIIAVAFPMRQARYLKVVQTATWSSNYWGLAELNVINTDPAFCSTALDGTPCNDGNSCSQTDTCQGGFCVGANPVVCSASDQCHQAGVCDPTTGACSTLVLPDGESCSDGNPCTSPDTCKSGTCVSGAVLTCVAQDSCHVAGACDPNTGECSSPAVADGTLCDDGDPCTQGDSCQHGVCAPGTSLSCGRTGQLDAPSSDAEQNMSTGLISATPNAPGAWLQFNNVDFGEPGHSGRFTVLLANEPGQNHVQLYVDSPSGQPIADLLTLPTDAVNPAPQGTNFASPASGVHTVFIVFATSDPNVLFDWFRLDPAHGGAVVANFPATYRHSNPGQGQTLTNVPLVLGEGDEENAKAPTRWFHTPKGAAVTLKPGDQVGWKFKLATIERAFGQASWIDVTANINITIYDSSEHVLASTNPSSGLGGGFVETAVTSELTPQPVSVLFSNNGTSTVQVSAIAGITP